MMQTVAAPLNARQMLMNFALYDPLRGLPSVLNRIDFTGVTRRQIFFNTLGRAPERGTLLAEGPKYSARNATAVALQGEEFQSRIREIILDAYQDKRRLMFVHIPKCAGTDLLVTLRRLYPYVHQHLASAAHTPKPAMFDQLRHIAIGANLADTIAVSGHVPLRWYVERNLVRFEDEVFTTIRHPRDLLYSFISFILTRFVEFPTTPRGDTTGWLAAIGLAKLAPDLTPAYLLDLGSRLLRSRAITTPNILCHYLGTGTAASAIDALIMCDVEITDTTRYSAWRTRKFGFEPGRRINPSQPLFTPETVPAADRDFIEGQIGEDLILYDAIMAKLAASDDLSVRGRAFL